MKVYLNKPDEEWIVDRFWDEWYEYNQNISTKNIDDADIISRPMTQNKIQKPVYA